MLKGLVRKQVEETKAFFIQPTHLMKVLLKMHTVTSYFLTSHGNLKVNVFTNPRGFIKTSDHSYESSLTKPAPTHTFRRKIPD